MGINLGGIKQDYSYLFSNLNGSDKNNSNNIFNAINLSDYNTIKSGSYGKMLKEYYKTENDSASDSSSKNTSSVKKENEEVKELKEVQTDAEALRDSAGVLMQKGSKSVFKGEDMSKVYSAVSDFIKDYNTLMRSGAESASKAVINASDGLEDLAKDYEKELKEIGITFDKDNKLVVDKDTFMKADIDKVKELFQGQNSFSYLTSVRAVFVGNTAYSESNKSSLYTGDGSYTTPITGDLFNSIV